MTHVGPAPVTAPPVSSNVAAPAGFVDWGAIVAGALLASALSFVLLTFGTAIGLSATSPWPNSGLSATALAALAVFWILAQQIGSFLAGGYIAGRMRTRLAGTPQDEVNFRDGLHGGLVWALGIVIGAALTMAAAGSVARTGAEVAGKATASFTASAVSPADSVLDTLLRPAAPAQPKQAAGGTAPPPGAGARAPATTMATAETRTLIGRILASSVSAGSLPGESRMHLAQLVSQHTGLSQEEAEVRVNNAIAASRDAADKARRGAVVAGLVTAVSLVISFAAAWWAALQGGHHRDNAIPARFDYFPRRDFGAPRPRP